MNQQCTLDDAIVNMDKLLAFILIEDDLMIKGTHIAKGWQQLKAIKEAYNKIKLLDKMVYRTKIKELDQKMAYQDDQYVQEVEYQLVFYKYIQAVEDISKLNDMVLHYRYQIVDQKRLEMEQKMKIVSEDLKKIRLRNTNRKEQRWIQILKESDTLILSIQNILQSKNDQQFQQNALQVENVLKSMCTSKRVKEEEEEEYLKMIIEIEKLKKLQEQQNSLIQKDDENLNQAQVNQDKNKSNMEKVSSDIVDANTFVQKRRRKKIMLFFTGIFASIGALGGKVSALVGGTFGAYFGRKVGNAVSTDKST